MSIDYSKRPKGTSRREYWAQITGNSKYDYQKNNLNYNNRPKGMSRREVWAQKTGNPKEDYVNSISNSGNNQANNQVNNQAPPKNKMQQFVDTSRIDSAYGEAKQTYLQDLKALTPRYEALYKQLEDEKQLALENEGVLSKEEQAQQKRNIAKRGISVDNSNQFYNNEADKLKQQEALRSKGTMLDFAGQRSNLSTAESADRRDITTAIANLDINKANTVENMIDSAKKMSSAQRQQDIENAMWQKTFNYNKSKDEADRTLALYKAAKSQTSSNNDKYNTALSSLVADAYSTPNPAKYTRETIEKTMQAKFPGDSKKIRQDISKFFPNGWEKMTPKETNNDAAKRELLDDIDKGASLDQLLKAYPDIPVDVIKKYYNG